jgi:hypothetical protein
MGKLTAEQKVCEPDVRVRIRRFGGLKCCRCTSSRFVPITLPAAKSLSSRAALPAGWRAYARRQRFQR